MIVLISHLFDLILDLFFYIFWQACVFKHQISLQVPVYGLESLVNSFCYWQDCIIR